MTSPSSLIQGSTEWHEWRLGGLGASEVAALLAKEDGSILCPYNTPTDVWLVKTKRKKGFEGNSFTEHGKETEAKARARYELKYMTDVEDGVVIVQHPKFPICRASLDGGSKDKTLILELKCPKGRQTIDSAKAGKVPDHYWPQVQWQLAASGADLLHFFVYHEDSGEDALVEVKPDVAYQGKILAICQAWWDKYVVTDTPPPLTSRDVKIVEDDPTIKIFCENLVARKDTIGKVALDELKAEIVRRAGHPKMRCGSVQISTVMRQGKFSYHKLTISDGAE